MTKKLTGLNPLSYLGVNAEKPPNLTIHDRDPLTTDYQGFSLGSFWLRPVVNRIYVLTDKTAGVSTWLEISTSSGGDDVESLIADDGLHAQPNVAGDITIAGGSNITTSANIPNQLKIDLNDDVIISGYLTATGNISTEGVLNLELTDDASTEGVIAADGDRFIHNYSPLNKSAYVGILAGNIDPTATGESNTGMGYKSLSVHTTAENNTAYGESSLINLLTGADNISIGKDSGSNYMGAESSNILIGSYGIAAETNKIRIGIDGSGAGEQDSCAIAGIYGVTPTGTANQSVIINANGELGSEGGSAGNAVPVGSIVRYDQTLPVGTSWLPCDGSAVSQATYASLFGVIGHKYLYPTAAAHTSPFAISCAAHNGLAGADGLWVAGGYANQIATSPDGITWTTRTSPLPGVFPGPYPFVSVAHNGLSGADGLWIMVNNEVPGYDHAVKSLDGITWTIITLSYSGVKCYTVAHNGLSGVSGLWNIGVAAGTTPKATLYRSNDTITWTPAGGLLTYGAYAADIVYSSVYSAWFVIARQSSHSTSSIFGSTNGINWFLLFMPGANSSSSNGEVINGLALLGSILCGVAQGKRTFSFIKSSNGYSFTTSDKFPNSRYPHSTYPVSIKSSSSSFLVSYAGDGRFYFSHDGTDFSEIPTPFTKGVPGVPGASIRILNSNNYSAPDDIWLSTGGISSVHYVWAPAINTATEFYLPNIEDQIILF